MKKIFTLLFILICSASLLSQSKEDNETAELVRSIKLSKELYWWDEVTVSKSSLDQDPQQREILRQSLKLGIANQIKCFVQGSVSVNETETDSYISSKVRHNVMINSNLYMKNIGYREFQKNKKQYTLFAYLKRSDFRAQEAEVIARINSIVAEARIMEARQQDDYLYSYYRAYLMSYNITRSFEGDNGEGDMQLWLENKLYSILREAHVSSTVTAGVSSSDKPVELSFDCPAIVSNLLVGMPSLGFRQLSVVDGKCKLFYTGQPSRKIEEHYIDIMINPALVAAEPEIAELANMRPISVQKTIELDFSFLFSADFHYQIEDMKVSFSPRYGDISVKSVDWDLGDGTRISSFNAFTHEYKASGRYQVSMLINGEYPVVKELYIDSPVKAREPAIQPPEPVPAADTPVSPVEIGSQGPAEAAAGAQSSPDTDPMQAAAADPGDLEGMELLRFNKVKELISYLNEQKTARKLTWGKLTRSSSLDGAWIVISEQDGRIIAVLQPQSGRFIDLLSESTIDDVFVSYRGKVAIYISYF
ncbi:MAG: hypothetical protein RBR69_01155 [Candidatus Cloacimonadaceae bacterium]|jgi:hypothetical protein|nr:hypothetical protein [Candidatus Cloacimonadota bacterium]MCK9179116.1 hypothetical protein [Candidatus Cloacimonadota bacterium]MDD3532913.1 hypothetical protein [Candidatus Cloacimonadota bacterium]MDY0126732.1 hypothetical protein [Candidatus Cloacimonadaceae bacterium]